MMDSSAESGPGLIGPWPLCHAARVRCLVQRGAVARRPAANLGEELAARRVFCPAWARRASARGQLGGGAGSSSGVLSGVGSSRSGPRPTWGRSWQTVGCSVRRGPVARRSAANLGEELAARRVFCPAWARRASARGQLGGGADSSSGVLSAALAARPRGPCGFASRRSPGSEGRVASDSTLLSSPGPRRAARLPTYPGLRSLRSLRGPEGPCGFASRRSPGSAGLVASDSALISSPGPRRAARLPTCPGLRSLRSLRGPEGLAVARSTSLLRRPHTPHLPGAP